MTPQQAPQTAESAPVDGGPAGAPPVVGLLRCWAARLTGQADSPLLTSVDDAARAGPLPEGLLEGFELYRRDAWLQYVANPATQWGRWTGGELDLPTYEVNRIAFGRARLRLRREMPFGPDEVLRFLAAFADAEEAGKLGEKKGELLRGVVVDIVCTALSQAGAAPDLSALLARLHAQHRSDAFRAAALRREAALRQPPPPALLACLRQVLAPPAHAEGCLTAIYEARLFRQAVELLSPYLPAQLFETGRAAVEALRAALDPDAELGAPLAQVCAGLNALGAFARAVRPLLAGPAAGPQRDWARAVLENFIRLGEVAGCILGPSASPAEVPPPVPLPAPEPTTASPPAPEKPVPSPAPEDAAVAELAATEPAAEQFQALARLAEEFLEAIKGRWPGSEEALAGLNYPAARFKQKLLRALQAPAADRPRQCAEAARQLADEFVNKIRKLDALLSGSRAEHGLGKQLKTLRDRLFAFMRAHGGYEEYPVAVGESVRKHGPALDDVSYVTDARLRADEIVQILEPGYVRRREDGRQELIRSPKVLVAR